VCQLGRCRQDPIDSTGPKMGHSYECGGDLAQDLRVLLLSKLLIHVDNKYLFM